MSTVFNWKESLETRISAWFLHHIPHLFSCFYPTISGGASDGFWRSQKNASFTDLVAKNSVRTCHTSGRSPIIGVIACPHLCSDIVSSTRENTTPESRCTMKKSSCRQTHSGGAFSAPRKLGKKRRLSLPDVRDETILHLSHIGVIPFETRP